ncbi:hypothetical protein E2C01_038300 [Portunus trituberculatus]|uniref:Uncharacterized protein n=1 Tax=Portunus trituberculatus TaxID=210409 RepID=A0A5B7FHN5_PORTR|nr:hypothetical protein [Portunus trituberculatus]
MRQKAAAATGEVLLEVRERGADETPRLIEYHLSISLVELPNASFSSSPIHYFNHFPATQFTSASPFIPSSSSAPNPIDH